MGVVLRQTQHSLISPSIMNIKAHLSVAGHDQGVLQLRHLLLERLVALLRLSAFLQC